MKGSKIVASDMAAVLAMCLSVEGHNITPEVPTLPRIARSGFLRGRTGKNRHNAPPREQGSRERERRMKQQTKNLTKP